MKTRAGTVADITVIVAEYRPHIRVLDRRRLWTGRWFSTVSTDQRVVPSLLPLNRRQLIGEPFASPAPEGRRT